MDDIYITIGCVSQYPVLVWGWLFLPSSSHDLKYWWAKAACTTSTCSMCESFIHSLISSAYSKWSWLQCMIIIKSGWTSVSQSILANLISSVTVKPNVISWDTSCRPCSTLKFHVIKTFEWEIQFQRHCLLTFCLMTTGVCHVTYSVKFNGNTVKLVFSDLIDYSTI